MALEGWASATGDPVVGLSVTGIAVVGDVVGDPVGSTVGDFEGDSDGLAVGDFVGDPDGERVGAWVIWNETFMSE